MKTIARILGLMSLAGTCMAGGNLTGTLVPPYPDGWNEQGGTCIGGGSAEVCAYSIGVVEKDGRQVLYLAKSERPSASREALWLVTDQMPYPYAPEGFEVVYGMCERNGKHDDTIVAVVKTDDEEWYTVVHSAYKANLATGRFERTPTWGV